MDQLYVELSDVKRDDIIKVIELLHNSGLIEDANEIDLHPHPQSEFLKDLGISVEIAVEKLKNSRIGVIGLSAHGAHLVLALANEGVGHIKCFDPSLITEEDLYLSSSFTEKDVGKKRGNTLVKNLQQTYPDTTFEDSKEIEFTEQNVDNWIQDCDFVVSCVDRGFSSVNYWLNKSALNNSLTWCTASLNGVEATIGPLVIPKKSACFMCYKMRIVANENSYNDAISYQKYLSERKKDETFRRSIMSVNGEILGGYLALECMKQILGIASSTLAGQLCIINFVTLTSEFHRILRRPDCPHCALQEKKKLVENKRWEQHIIEPVNILELESLLVSPRVGIIKGVHRLLKDGLEPEFPYVAGVLLSNFNFQDDPDMDSLTCSGKGMTLEDMKISALGEAIERYCSSQYDERELTVAKYSELENVVHPEKLVLFTSEQYSSNNFPYSEYKEETIMQWSTGYSLINRVPLIVPAISVYLDFRPINKNEFLFAPTSNGLAAGSSLVHATLGALLEVIERDAFIITWLCKLPMPQVNLTSVRNNHAKNLIEAYDRRGVDIAINALMLDTGVTTFMATAIDSNAHGPAALVGLSSHPIPEVGILKSIQEIGQIRPHIIREMRKPDYPERISELMDFHNVKTIQDHALLYTDPTMVEAFDFLLKDGPTIDIDQIPRGPNGDYYETLDWCRKQMKKLSNDIIATDLTTTDIASLGLSVVRTIVPEFQPIHFGYDERRLGGVRLFELPKSLGLSSRTLTSRDLNKFPHPLA